jgi:hypothetical protein
VLRLTRELLTLRDTAPPEVPNGAERNVNLKEYNQVAGIFNSIEF